MRQNEINWVAGGTIGPCRFVKPDTAEDLSCLQAGAGDMTVGISHEGMRRTPGLAGSDTTIAYEDGDSVEVFAMGERCLLELGTGGAVRGDRLKSDADGKGVITTTAGQHVGAIALASGAAGVKIPVLVLPPSSHVAA